MSDYLSCFIDGRKMAMTHDHSCSSRTGCSHSILRIPCLASCGVASEKVRGCLDLERDWQDSHLGLPCISLEEPGFSVGVGTHLHYLHEQIMHLLFSY